DGGDRIVEGEPGPRVGPAGGDERSGRGNGFDGNVDRFGPPGLVEHEGDRVGFLVGAVQWLSAGRTEVGPRGVAVSAVVTEHIDHWGHLEERRGRELLREDQPSVRLR